MGYYIEVPMHHHKAKQMVDIYNAELVLSPESFDLSGPDALLCVVENDLFDAVGIAFDEHERSDWLDPNDDRPKTWLKIPKKLAIKLNPRVEDVLS